MFEWKKEPERSVSERRRREAWRRRRRGSSAEGARSFNAAIGGLGERCKLPQRVQAEPGRQTTFGAFWSENAMQPKGLGSAVSCPSFNSARGSGGAL